jgi:hypothetical protein
VEPKSREEANDASGNTFGSDGQSMMLRDRTVGERINAASRAHEEPLAVEAQQKLSGDSKSLNITRTDQCLVRGEAQNTFCWPFLSACCFLSVVLHIYRHYATGGRCRRSGLSNRHPSGV